MGCCNEGPVFGIVPNEHVGIELDLIPEKLEKLDKIKLNKINNIEQLIKILKEHKKLSIRMEKLEIGDY